MDTIVEPLSSIYVPSKARLASPTIRALIEEGIDHEVWVHGSEIFDYEYAYPGIRLVAHNLDDIGAIRHAIMEEARATGREFCWQVDDDIRRTLYRPPGEKKHYPVSWRRWLRGMEQELGHWPTVAIGGPLPVQYAWSSQEPTLNGHANGIAVLRTHAPIDYLTGVIEDWDIVFQAWAAGWHSIRFSQFAYDFPKMGTSPGGMEEAYAAGWQEPRRAATLEK